MLISAIEGGGGRARFNTSEHPLDDIEVPALQAYCKAYIDENELYPDLERCPQYELCRPSRRHMNAIRGQCENVYAS